MSDLTAGTRLTLTPCLTLPDLFDPVGYATMVGFVTGCAWELIREVESGAYVLASALPYDGTRCLLLVAAPVNGNLLDLTEPWSITASPEGMSDRPMRVCGPDLATTYQMMQDRT